MRSSDIFTYTCLKCNGRMPKNWKFMVCKCGGYYYPDSTVSILGTSANFDAGWDPTLKCYVSSWKEAEKKAANFKTKQHPYGLSLIQDNKKFLKECKELRNAKKDIEKERKKMGIGKFAKAAVFLMLFASTAYAEVNIFEGIPKATITIDGSAYTFPIGDNDRYNEIYFLKKALKGDKDALEIFLGGQEEKWFFIGMDTPLWLKADKHGNFKVIKP